MQALLIKNINVFIRSSIFFSSEGVVTGSTKTLAENVMMLAISRAFTVCFFMMVLICYSLDFT